ncbi:MULTISPECIES: pyridoxal phosphate-dependent aminotransferase [Halomonadaceae]|uniref:pyridoxal phosphate-dependent aminotransferase n=1 Tax=Halomonadaceae TaxID=28256 RepID=UPI001583EA6A|nr:MULTISPECIES: aminotransferase class I/II-fold pyridoxal phosphate-dependent enzyme [Halomonas]MDI4636002.1 aminotransferase class I/II-fold pyridoxal phosphate-dependent enzyme [Halomonas sp. BMC7]NUJ60367.1 aminotransferase class I/II-fold pyridoxal phosphate-dependent enzyme [Halomonas taeanensis]
MPSPSSNHQVPPAPVSKSTLTQRLNAGEAPRASDTLLINEQTRLREAGGERIVKFGFGQSPFPVFTPAVEALAAHAADKAYLPVQGLAEAREAVAAFHREVDGVDWQAEEMLLAPGSKLLLFALMKALPADAEVLIPDPAWVSYAPQARMCHLATRRVTCSFESRWQINAASLEAALSDRDEPSNRVRLLILNQPGNPTGLSLDHAEQAKLADVARHHDLLVLSDEIYGVLDHDGSHRAFARDYPEGTVTTTGLSKWCGAGGWRFGAMHVPAALGEALFSRLLGIASETWSSVASPVQQAACVAYQRTPALEAYINRQRQILTEVGQWAAQELDAAGIRTHAPDGGFYLYPDFEAHRQALAQRGITTGSELTQALLEECGVALLPGAAFGAPAERLTARLAYVDFDGEALLATSGSVIADPGLEKVRDGIHALTVFVKSLEGGSTAASNA